MMELEYMQRAKMYMDKLALRIDPITDRPLPGDTALNQVRLFQCFAYVSDVLGRVIENGGIGGSSTRTQPICHYTGAAFTGTGDGELTDRHPGYCGEQS